MFLLPGSTDLSLYKYREVFLARFSEVPEGQLGQPLTAGVAASLSFYRALERPSLLALASRLRMAKACKKARSSALMRGIHLTNQR